MKIASLVAVAKRFDFVRETLGPNRGAFVQKFQRENGGSVGESWCADFLCFVLDIAFDGMIPIKRSPACATILDEARMLGLEVLTPAVDDLYFYLNDVGHAHHCGIVTSIDPLSGIAGNTSSDGRSSDGVGVFDHAIGGRLAFVRLP
jgi:hypothetical protein